MHARLRDHASSRQSRLDYGIQLLQSAKQKNHAASLVLAAIALGLAILVNLPFHYVELNATWRGNLEVNALNSAITVENIPHLAGWPFQYWVRYEIGTESQDRFWSTKYLIADIAIALIFVIVVYSCSRWRFRILEKASNIRRTRIALDTTITFVTLLSLAGPIVAGYYQTQQHRQLLHKLLNHGQVLESSWVPAPLANSLPSGVVKLFVRMRQVRLVRASDEMLQQIVELPSITSIGVLEGKMEASFFDRLKDSHHLYSMLLSSTRVDQESVDSIAKLRWLEQLQLSNCNLDSDLFHRLDHLQHLSHLNIRNTQVDLSSIANPRWSQSIRELRFSRPNNAAENSIHIDGWPHLKRLSIRRRSTTPNENLLTIELSNLPNFERLDIDRMQKHSLRLVNLPRLTSIDEDLYTLYFDMTENDTAPGLTWLHDLYLEGAASLTDLTCYARDLQSFHVRDTPRLKRLELGSYRIDHDGIASLEQVDSTRCQEWIDHLGASDGPSTLDLSGLPLRARDLSPLVDNEKIRDLRLGCTNIQFDQIRGLQGMEQLQSLDINDCSTNSTEFHWLIEHFPQLAQLRIDSSSCDRLQLHDQPRLSLLETNQFQNLRELVIVNAPEMEASLHLKSQPEKLVVRQADSLRGLVLEKPWPAEAELSDVRSLEWFSAGGQNLGDSVVHTLLNCASLSRLALAYTSVSREQYIQIGKLRSLTSLMVPGSAIDDSITDHWHELMSLNEVNLDETAIDKGTMRWLSQIEPLRRLTLNRMALSDEAALILSRIPNLESLELSDTIIMESCLIELLKKETIEHLDVSGWTASQSLAQALAECQSLRRLNIDRCGFSEPEIQQMLSRNPYLTIKFDQTANHYSHELDSMLQARMMRFRQRRARQFIHSMHASYLVNVPNDVDGQNASQRKLWADHPSHSDFSAFRSNATP